MGLERRVPGQRDEVRVCVLESLRRLDRRWLLFVAEEMGAETARSILRQMYHADFTRPVRLVYWASTPSRLVLHAEFSAYVNSYLPFAYHAVVRCGGPGWFGRVGDIADTVHGLITDASGLVAHVAGSDDTIERVRGVLTAKGMAPDAILCEVVQPGET